MILTAGDDSNTYICDVEKHFCKEKCCFYGLSKKCKKLCHLEVNHFLLLFIENSDNQIEIMKRIETKGTLIYFPFIIFVLKIKEKNQI